MDVQGDGVALDDNRTAALALTWAVADSSDGRQDLFDLVQCWAVYTTVKDAEYLVVLALELWKCTE